MDDMNMKKLLVLMAILVLFHFYYTYYRVTQEAQRRLKPWKRALKRIK